MPPPSAVSTIVAYREDGIKIEMAVRRESATRVSVVSTSTSDKDYPLSDYCLEMAVPKYLETSMEAASSSTLECGTPIVQRTVVGHEPGNNRPLLLRLRIRYSAIATAGAPAEQISRVVEARLPSV